MPELSLSFLCKTHPRYVINRDIQTQILLPLKQDLLVSNEAAASFTKRSYYDALLLSQRVSGKRGLLYRVMFVAPQLDMHVSR